MKKTLLLGVGLFLILISCGCNKEPKIKEEDVIAWSKYNGLDFIRCACRFTENLSDGYGESKRLEIKNLIKELKKTNPQVEDSIFNSINDVCIDTFPYIKTNGIKHSFLEAYNDEGE